MSILKLQPFGPKEKNFTEEEKELVADR